MTDEEMLNLLSHGDAELRRTWTEVVDYMRRTHQLEEIQRLIEQGRYEEITNVVQRAAERLAQEWARQFAAAAMAAAHSISEESGRLISYDTTNSFATRALDLRRLEIVTDLTAEQRQLIQQVIARGLQDGKNPLQVARDLRSSVGLTPAQEQIVANYEQALRRGDFASVRARQLHDDRFNQALQQGRILTEDQIDRMVDRYRQNWINLRAETIARTEALRALHEGTAELFRQAFESGELDPDEIEVIWSSALRATTRDSHRTMHGQKRRPGEAFVSGNGVTLRYPGDPAAPPSETVNCLCVLQRRMKPRMEVALSF